MINLSKDGFSHKEVEEALHAAHGIRNVGFRYELLKNGVRERDIQAEGSISLNIQDSIQRTAQLTLYEEIDWLKSLIKIYMRLPISRTGTRRISLKNWGEIAALGATFHDIRKSGFKMGDLIRGYMEISDTKTTVLEWPLGVFVPTSPQKKYLESGRGAYQFSVDCYDKTVWLREDGFTDRYFIPFGTSYLDAINAILVQAGIENVIFEGTTNAALPADREFEIGESKLDVINTLLAEINYNPIYCDADGTFLIKPYKEPGLSTKTYQYRTDELSVISAEANVTQDFYGVPNVFIATSSNPDVNTDYRSVYVNDNPASPLSTIQRGRSIVSQIYQLDMVASQEELDGYIRKKAFEANQIYEEIEFTTALMPIHGSGDVLELEHPAGSGIYLETGWEMSLVPDGQMQHRAKRIVNL